MRNSLTLNEIPTEVLSSLKVSDIVHSEVLVGSGIHHKFTLSYEGRVFTVNYNFEVYDDLRSGLRWFLKGLMHIGKFTNVLGSSSHINVDLLPSGKYKINSLIFGANIVLPLLIDVRCNNTSLAEMRNYGLRTRTSYTPLGDVQQFPDGSNITDEIRHELFCYDIVTLSFDGVVMAWSVCSCTVYGPITGINDIAKNALALELGVNKEKEDYRRVNKPAF